MSRNVELTEVYSFILPDDGAVTVMAALFVEIRLGSLRLRYSVSWSCKLGVLSKGCWGGYDLTPGRSCKRSE